MGVSLVYNSRNWDLQSCGGAPCGLYMGGWRVVTPFGENDLSFFAKHVGCPASVSVWEMNVYWIDGSGSKRRYMEKVSMGNCNASNQPSFDQRTLPFLDGDGSKLYTGQYNSNGSDTAYILFKDGTRRYFRTAYSSSSITYDLITPNGNYLVRDTSGLPTQDTIGRTITFQTNYSSSPTSYYERYKITDANGSLQTYQVNYTYPTVVDPQSSNSAALTGKSRHISSIDLPNGQSWQFLYNTDQGYLTKATFPTGAYILYAYGGTMGSVATRKVSSDGTSGTEKTWTYAAYGWTGYGRTVTDPENGRVRYGYNSTGTANATFWEKYDGGSTWLPLKTVETSWSQAAGEDNGQANKPRVNSITTILDSAAQSTKTATYDSDNDVTQEKVTEWSFGAAGPVVSQTDITYTTIASSFKRIASKTLTAINPATGSSATQGKTEYVYDEGSGDFTGTANRGIDVPNHTHSVTRTGRGNLTTTKAYFDASNHLDTQMKYDNVGNVIETIDPSGFSTKVGFNDDFTSTPPSPFNNGKLFAFPTEVKTVIDTYDHIATSKYDYNTGLVKEVTNVRGNTTTTTYDLMNRITSVSEPAVGGVSKVTSYAYDDTNRKTTKEVTVSSGNVGHVETFFDKLYRTVKTITNDPEGAITVETEYDGNGRVKKTSNPYRSGETVKWTQTTYGGLSRPVTITAPDSSTVTYSYVNNVTTTTDQAGNQRRYTYNVLGQLTKVEEPSPTLDTPAVTTYKYYGFGPLYQSTQSNSTSAQNRTWVYNWLGQMTSQTLPESGTTTFTYDSAGRLSTKADARIVTGTTHVTTSMSYDAAGRLTGRSYNDGTPAVSFLYPPTGQFKGLRTAMTDAIGSVTYTYDARDRLVQEARDLTGIGGTRNDCSGTAGDPGTFFTCYKYNIKGDLTEMTYPSGRVVEFKYKESGGCCNSRLEWVKDDTTSLTVLDDLHFNAASGVTSQALNPGTNAITQTFTYDANRLQLTRIQAAKGTTGIMDFTYDYGTPSTNTGRVLKRTDAIQPEHSANYSYDSLYRLIQASAVHSSWAISWGLDTYGNRTSQSSVGVASSKVGSQSMSIDTSTNRISDTYISYDNAGNLTHEPGSGTHAYAYNAENQQISMDGGAATYYYDGEGRRMKKVTSGETTYTFYGPGGILSEFSMTNTGITAASSSDKTIYRTSEKTGTAVLLFNTSGTVIENNRTLPYGEAWLTDVASANDKKFTTYDRDKESGLDYAMNRMYASTMGRMTSPDRGPNKIAQPTSLNRYTYGNLDPINHIDPSGNTPQTVGSVMECDFAGGNVTAIYLFGTAFPNDAYYGGYQYSYFVTGYECDVPDPIPATGGEGDTNVEVGGQGGNIVLGPSTAMSFSERLSLAYMKAMNALSGRNCAKLFNTSGSGRSPSSLLSDLYEGVGGSIKSGTFETKYLRGNDVTPRATTQAQTNMGINADGQRINRGLIPVITINKDINFTSSELAALLLHELGHVFNLSGLGFGGSRIVNDNNSTMQGVADSNSNRQLISDNCRF